MKRVGYLYDKVMNIENVLMAWDIFNSRRPVKLRREVDVKYAEKILNEMKTDFASVIGRPRIKYIFESGKRRRLQIPSFKSTIAQTALWNVCGDYIDKRIHDNSFSSRLGKGGHKAAHKVEKFVHTNGDGDAKYCLYFDVRKYYQHIDKRILMDRLATIFKDERILEMFRTVVYSADDGLPIGYPFSHALANLFLVPLYYDLRSIRGISRVYVYMDNWLVFSRSKKPLHRALVSAKHWLDGVGCEVKHDWQVFPTESRGVRVCGLVVTHGRTRLYDGIWHRIMRNFDRYRENPTERLYLSLMSRLGWLKAINFEYSPIFMINGRFLWQKKK